MDELDKRIIAYKKGLNHLPSASAENDPEKVRELLLARDDISSTIKIAPKISSKQHREIGEADKRLKAQTEVIVKALPKDTFTHWREIRLPATEAWWWFLDHRLAKNEEAAEEEAEKSAALWILLTGLLVTISLSFTSEILRRFFSGGSDWLSIVNTIVQTPLLIIQGGLALLAGGALTEPGRQWIEKLLKYAGLYRGYGARKRLVIAAVVFVLVLAIRLSLPYFAYRYNERAVQQLTNIDVSGALQSYRRALSLDPDYVEAHYGLATTYEQLQKYDEAIIEYESAIRLNNRFKPAQSSLTRLYLRRGKDADFANALQILNQQISELEPGTPQSAEARNIQYALYKNRGWANYKLNYVIQAESDLKKAIDIRGEGAAVHCYLGFVLEAKKDSGSKDEWEDCIRYAPGETDVDATLLNEAKEHYRRQSQ